MPGSFGPLFDATHAMAEGGALVALSTVCLLQYFHYLSHRSRSRQLTGRLRRAAASR